LPAWVSATGIPRLAQKAISSRSVLAEGERHRPALGRIGQDRDRPVQGRHDLLGARNAVEIPRHRTETVVDADRSIPEVLDLLQNRIGPAAGEHVARDQQHR
jgi:hypothetical protein